MIDCSEIGSLAAQVMEEIADSARELQAESTVRTVAIVVELDRPDSTGLMIRSTEDRRWALTAFLDAAADSLNRATVHDPDIDD
jgi:hypothetical protein